MPVFVVDADACVGCEACMSNCPAELYEMVDGHAQFKVDNADDCVECNACIENCPAEAISKQE